MKNRNALAFSVWIEDYLELGLTKREYFAAAAMKGFLASSTDAGLVELSGLAVHQADELLKALSSITADYIAPSGKTITLTSYEFALMVDVWKAADHNFKNVSLLEDCETFNNIAAKLGII